MLTKKEERLNELYAIGRLSKAVYWAQKQFGWRPMVNKDNGLQAWYQYLLLGCLDGDYKYPDDYHDPKLRGQPIRRFAWRIGRQSGKTECLAISALYLAVCKPIKFTITEQIKDPSKITADNPGGVVDVEKEFVRGAKIIMASADADKARTVFDRVMKFINESDKFSAALETGAMVVTKNPFPEIKIYAAGWTEPATITFRGPGAGGQTARSKTFDYKLYDEADYMPQVFFEAEKATGINAGKHGLVILSSTPTGRREYFYSACFVAGTPVNMADGSLKSIEDVKIGDMVLNRFGKPEPVTNIMNREYEGKLITFMTPLNAEPITGTSNHRFMSVIKRTRYCKGCQRFVWKNRTQCVLHGEHTGLEKVQPEYNKMNDLGIGDFLAIPISSVENPESIRLAHIEGDFVYVPITQYEAVNGKATVYNLTVGEDHSYCVNYYGVANCTRPDWNYQEFHIPSKENPNFTQQMDLEFRREHPRAVYEHEIEADWGTVEEGVFDWTYFEWVFRPWDIKMDPKTKEAALDETGNEIKIPIYRIFDTEYGKKRKPYPDEYERINLTDHDVERIGYNNIGLWVQSKLPPRQDSKRYWFGADLGYQADPTEFVVFEEYNGVMKMILRMHMEHVKYHVQADLIALLDNFYQFAALGMDEGGNGLSVMHVLLAKEDGWNKFAKHNFEKRLHPINFGKSVQVTSKIKGETKLVPVKQFMTDAIIMQAQNRLLIMPSVEYDDDVENQFRNHNYSMGEGGKIVYSKSTIFPDHIVDAVRTCFFAKAMAKLPKNRAWPVGRAFRQGGAGRAWGSGGSGGSAWGAGGGQAWR